ncbi:diacylglycerol kinase [Vibrio sp. 10N.286.49.C2]|uniref:type 3 dihydrofolate reductase n=1 Tax=unclassified Vibrio TaxID=2614977 RepID=UPI000C853B50|nr:MULTISPECIES: type 3 dihydrofolate reductase [unclassified Vibrio]PMH27573.1 diacylglycerol kinase [Vibrio sp. 10N.286.49.C2]PMH52999.1 diacylglycerol kinase [Vibrio sp. 10N.286.49.B1]PMH79222.1 diacylglycerol kinase [Vibrio sp. 10N.286.48.B7]
MIISMIAAMADNRIIGKENQMPWHLPADFMWFKKCTMGKPVIMGRKTYDSIGRALPGRRNIVVSRDANLAIEGVDTVTSLEEGIALVSDEIEVMIIGGGSFYSHCLPLATKLYLTFIDAEIDGDTQFPQWGEDWIQTYNEPFTANEKNRYNMNFVVLEKQ